MTFCFLCVIGSECSSARNLAESRARTGAKCRVAVINEAPRHTRLSPASQPAALSNRLRSVGWDNYPLTETFDNCLEVFIAFARGFPTAIKDVLCFGVVSRAIELCLVATTSVIIGISSSEWLGTLS
ncbi:hypothetical protein QAD02_018437 [Eretmocerus hayati]|uniref:Uncharacterized protein n=1 Tax=Eretmocerus hayati TaxID=131215 RepID=A0ACC2PGD9_9HYME|nr:hypothetical protein QAD02_018437 [Eretmocerus hayati]